MDWSDLEQKLRQELAELEAIAAQAKDSAAIVELDQTRVGRLSRMDAMQAQAVSAASNARRQQKMAQIRQALQRIADDDYGWCEGCGEAIDPRRLEVKPAARMCIDCAERAQGK